MIPCNTGSAVAGIASLAVTNAASSLLSLEFSSLKSLTETICPGFSTSLSPASSTTFIPKILSFSSIKSILCSKLESKNLVSPASIILTFLIICLTIISKCLSSIFTPCKRYTSCISFTKYSCTAVGPLIFKISVGVIAPSDNGIPARIKSFS